MCINAWRICCISLYRGCCQSLTQTLNLQRQVWVMPLFYKRSDIQISCFISSCIWDCSWQSVEWVATLSENYFWTVLLVNLLVGDIVRQLRTLSAKYFSLYVLSTIHCHVQILPKNLCSNFTCSFTKFTPDMLLADVMHTINYVWVPYICVLPLPGHYMSLRPTCILWSLQYYLCSHSWARVSYNARPRLVWMRSN